MKAGLATAGLAVALAACQPAYLDGRPNLDSPYYRPPTGSTVEILAPLPVAARSDRVYLQQGRNLPWYDVNEFRAYCALLLEDRADQARTIEPGRYTVRAVASRTLFQLARTSRPRALPVMRSDRDDSRDDYRVLALVMKLAGPDPQVQALACADWGIPQGGPRVTVRVIRAALGDRVALRLAEPAGGSAP